MATKFPKSLLKKIEKVTNKRARVVLDQIVANGSITTEQLKQLGYDHPPRAARDVRELGFNLVTTRVKATTGRPIAAYTLGTTVSHDVIKSGRMALPKQVRNRIIADAVGKCQICGAVHNLQVDHRVPFEVAGEALKGEKHPYMVLCGSCNRTKSWACEHCDNFRVIKKIDNCRGCYWAHPEQYSHIALQQHRRVDILWLANEVSDFDIFKAECVRQQVTPAEGLKRLIASSLK